MRTQACSVSSFCVIGAFMVCALASTSPTAQARRAMTVDDVIDLVTGVRTAHLV